MKSYSFVILKIKNGLANKNIRVPFYVIYFLFLYVIAWFLSRKLDVSDLVDLNKMHDILIQIEINVLRLHFDYFNLFGSVRENILIFTNSNSIRVEPGCSGLIPMLRIFFVLIFFPGPWQKKLWYIPLSLLLVFIAALIHLFILSYIIIYLPQQYDVTHDYITKIIFYGMYFLIWLYWLEKFVLKKKKKKAVISS